MSERTRADLGRMLAGNRIDLAEANLLICAEADPRVDIPSALARVDALAERSRSEGVVEVLRDAGFTGTVDDYDEPANSFLSEVLDRRRGIPVALCTLALAVAERAGAAMAGIGMPGHFVLADLRAGGPAYIDPFGGWARLDAADCARLVERTTGLPFRPEHLRPVSERAILIRTLRNLRGSYLRRRRLSDALWTVELSLIVAPDDPGLVRDAVTLLAGAGRYPEAEAAASSYLSSRPGDPAAPALEAQRETVRDLIRRMN